MGDWCIFTPIDVITRCVVIFKLSLNNKNTWFLSKKDQENTAALNSAMFRLTDECLVLQIPQKNMGKTWVR